MIFSFILLTGCSEEEKDNIIPSIDIDPRAENISMDLSDFSDRMNIIKLETNAECHISSMSYLIAIDHEYILFYSDKSILVFNRDGKFINKIDSRGKGPQEYSTIVDSFYDDIDNLIYITDHKNVYVYDIYGKFVKVLKTDFSPSGLFKKDSLFFLPHSQRYSDKERLALDIFDNNMVKIKSFQSRFKSDTKFKQNLFFGGHPSTSGKEILFKEPFVDTIFKISGELELKPHYVINLEEYKMLPSQELNINNRNEAHLQGKISTPGIWETPGYFFFKYYFADELIVSIFDKKKSKFIFHQKNDFEELNRKKNLGKTSIGIDNNLNNKITAFWPSYVEDSRLVQVVFPVNLSPSQIEKLGSNVNDNPIIFEVKLK